MEAFFSRHMDVVFFVYGLAFFVMGVFIWAKPKQESELPLARILWLLAGFGILHGINEFLDMWVIIKGGSRSLDIVRPLFLIGSFIFLFEFGRKLVRMAAPEGTGPLGWFAGPGGRYVSLIAGMLIIAAALSSPDFWRTAAILSRYLLGFPGSLLTGLGLISFARTERETLAPFKVTPYFFLSGGAFIVYGFLSGLIVPQSSFFPSTILNADAFLSTVHAPVQVFRACCAVLAAFSIGEVLRIFTVEIVCRLKADLRQISGAQEALKRSHEFTRTVLDSMNDAISIIDVASLRIIDINLVFLQEVGMRKADALGKTCHEVTHVSAEPCGPPHDVCPVEELLSTGTHTTVEHVHFDKDGNKVYVEVSVSPLWDDAGKITQIIHLSRDITKRKNAEAELLWKHRDLQALYEQVSLIKKEWELSMDCTSDMILMIDDANRIKRCNRTMKEFTGLQYADILQRDWCELMNSHGMSAGLMSDGTPEQGAELYHAQTQQWFSLNSYPYADEALGIAGTVLTIHDITQRKNMTEALEITNQEIEKNRSKLENALAEIDNLIQQVTFKRDFSVRFANPHLKHCREVMHCTKTECACHAKDGQRCWQTVGTFCGGRARGAFTDNFENCTECPTYKLATSDPIYQIGESFNNMMHILTVQHGELEQAYNDLKVAQSRITQQEKMASIGQLAAGVAHEINNPTGFIMSNLGSLQKYVDRLTEFIRIQDEALKSLPPERLAAVDRQRKALKVDFITDDLQGLLKESLDGADRIKKIVQDLKSFSRVDEAELKMADINAGIESTINIVWNELKYKVVLKKEYGDLPQIKCNPGQLNQVFMNMLVNAAHAIEKQGEIGIRTWAGNGAIHISISDTGGGIPKDKLSRIFEPFFTTKEIGKGTGLGLSIAYDIVKKHKGEITVESAVGKGTTFTVTIPVVEK